MSELVLQVKDLKVSFSTADGIVQAVNGISFDVRKGQTLGIVGESGSGKSVTASSIMGLINRNSADMSGSILLGGLDVLTAQEREIRALRGREAAMVFQDPMSALNPYYTVGKQIAEAYEVHHPKSSKKERQLVALDMLAKVGLPKPSECIDEYPHQFSGGMRQRIVIAIALVNTPRLLIADEPTTALDATVQAQILVLLDTIRRETGMALVTISHDLGVISEISDRVLVMYAGSIVESAPSQTLFSEAQHPYSLGLLAAMPLLNAEVNRLTTIRGSLPQTGQLMQGCRFEPRCDFAQENCRASAPALKTIAVGHVLACNRKLAA